MCLNTFFSNVASNLKIQPCVKSVQRRSFYWTVFSCIRTETGKHAPEKTPYLDTFYAVPDYITVNVLLFQNFKSYSEI